MEIIEFTIFGAYDILKKHLKSKGVGIKTIEFEKRLFVSVRLSAGVRKDNWIKELFICFCLDSVVSANKRNQTLDEDLCRRHIEVKRYNAKDFLNNQAPVVKELIEIGLEKYENRNKKLGSYLYGRMLSEKSGRKRWIRSNYFTRGATESGSEGGVPLNNKQPNGDNGCFKGRGKPERAS